MKSFPNILTCCALVATLGASVLAAEAQDDAKAKQLPTGSITAEIWPFDVPADVSPRATFEQWRSRQPAGDPKTLTLDGLAIPARERSTMVRIAGVLNAPITGNYAFLIHAPGKRPSARADETELWILDDRTGEWRLAQTAGNPNKRTGRTRMEQGVPRRFELWSMGSAAVTIEWEVSERDPVAKGPVISLARQIVPAAACQPRSPAPDDRHGSGLRDSWKQRHGLALDKTIGPDSPWGDPDADGLLNWQEQLNDFDPLKADSEGRDGLVRWELWRDIPGRYVFDLRRAAHFPTGPRETRFLNRLEIPTGNGDRYGSRVRGLLVAPADGEYTFKITASYGTELWLGTNETWQSKRLITFTDQQNAGHAGWIRRNDQGEQIPLFPEQSATVSLNAGRQYYLDILQKHDSSSDHCAVAWVLPGAEQPAPITAKHLVSWRPSPTDTDDDGLPDDWQRSTGLLAAGVAPAQRHCEADADLDGATNHAEWLAGTAPLDAGDFPITTGMLTSQSWTKIPGHHIAALTEHPNFPARPDFTTRIDNLDFGQEGENYGVRLRGYLTAPDDGDYSFSIAGNNAAVLYLAGSEDKFTKRVVARVEVGTQWRSFGGGGRLDSGPVPLKRGKSYYIEVLFKRGINGKNQEGQLDHSSVAWTRPGRKQTVIAPEFFSPYKADPRDLDDDDLPDDFEKLHELDPTAASGNHGAWGDPDGDGLENLREFQRGLNPSRADVHGSPGLVLWEGWDKLPDLVSAHRDRGGLAPAFLADLRYPLHPTRREWRDELEAPRRQGTNVGGRLRAHIVAPKTGEYVFSIAGRDVGELYLSPDDSKFNRQRVAAIAHSTGFRSWDLRPGQMSNPVRLVEGKTYYIEALYGRGTFQYSDDFLSVGWKPPGADTFSLIGSKHLVAFFRDPNDQDDDDLPDDWEKRHGLDFNDPRGHNGPQGDPDRDRLTNMEEYRLGTDPLKRDTDGDGISDYDEVHVYRTNPLVPDGVPPVHHSDFTLDRVIAPLGTWLVNSEGALTSTAMRGAASFEFAVETPGLYVVRLDASVIGVNGYAPPVPVSALVDGAEIGRGVVVAEGAINSWISRWLGAGTHVLTIQNHNTKFNVNLMINSLELLRMDGEDATGNGLPVWYENIIQPMNAFDLPLNEDIKMNVSPACIEGITRMPGGVTLNVNGLPCEALPGIGKGWYANIPLAAEEQTVVEGKFEGGAITNRLNLVWVAVNPFEVNGRLSVRVGDSMKFAVPQANQASQEERFSLSVDGIEVYSGEAGPEVTVRFDRAGEHLLEATHSRTTGVQTCRVVIDSTKADFGPILSVAAGVSRNWTLPGVPSHLTLECDPLLQLLGTQPLEPSGMKTSALWTGSGAAQPLVLARLGDGGPVVASTRLNVINLVDAAVSGDAHVVEVLPDGTRVVEISYVIEGRIPSDFSMWIDFYVTDAVFADGSTRYQLTAGDFDESGVVRIRIYKAAGTGPAFVCHWNRLFEDDGAGSPAPASEREDAE